MITVVIILIILLLIWFFWRREKSVNFDNNATTEPYREVVSAMSNAAFFGNPSSFYAKSAADVVHHLRELVLSVLGKTDHHCIITSGASESNNLMLRGYPGLVYVSAMEHKTSIECAKKIKAPLIHGDTVDLMIADLQKKHAGYAGSLISVMAVNNETGNMNDMKILDFCRANGATFHSDIAQFFGKFDRTNPIHRKIASADCLSISFHKIHGPVGIGALIIPKNLSLSTQIEGTQNDGIRGGTENVMACAGAIEAILRTLHHRTDKNYWLFKMKNELQAIIAKHCDIECFKKYQGQTDLRAFELSKYAGQKPFGAVFLSRNAINTVLVSFLYKKPCMKRFCNIEFRKTLAENGIKISIGSACSTNQKGASHVLHEMRAPFIIRAGAVRFSVGDFNTAEDFSYFDKVLGAVLKEEPTIEREK